MHLNQISGAIVDSAMKVHTALGPGLLESVYLACLVHEIETERISYRRAGAATGNLR